MLRRSNRTANRKILKTGGGDDDNNVASASNCDPSTAITHDVGGESSSPSAFASAEINPLQNSVILNHLFKLCSPGMLVTCRLVCKQWYEESLLSFRNASPLKFTVNDDGDIFRDYQYYRKRRTVPLQTFLDTVDPQRLHQGKSYPSIHFRDSKIDFHITKKKQFKIFWNAFGGNLTTLEFYNCTFLDHEEFRSIIFFRCPKLKRLVIESCEFSLTRNYPIQQLPPLDYNGKEQPFEQNRHLKLLKIVGEDAAQRKLPVSWVELFSHFPLLSSLTNRCNVDKDDAYTYNLKLPVDEFDSLIKAIRIIRKRDENLLPFKVFDVGAIVISGHPSNKLRLLILQELRLPLQGLFVVVAEPAIDEGFFRETFAFCAKTLKYLCLAGWIQTPAFSEFPFGHQLDNLTNLSIAHDFPKYLTLLKYVPNLERLYIAEWEGDAPQKITISNVDMPEPIHLNMVKLRHLSLDFLMEDEDIAKFYDLMPKITELLVHVNDKQFGIVCEKWKNLKNLHVLGNRLTDKGVTGKKGANITNLQNLENFRFESHKLSAVSVFNGFLQLPSLRILSKFGTKPIRWGQRTRQAIMDKNIRFEWKKEDEL